MTNKEYSEIIDKVTEIYVRQLDKKVPEMRVGDAGTPLSFDEVIEDEDKRTTVVRWSDGKVTKCKADPEDEYDFTVGLAICIAKKLTNSLPDLAKAIRSSKTRYRKIGSKKNDKKDKGNRR